jgi:hypothetical protein
MKSNLDYIRSIYKEQKDVLDNQQVEEKLPLTEEEKRYMMEYMQMMESNCNEMYGGPSKYEESAKQVNRVIDIAERLTKELSEADGSKVDDVMMRREVKRLVDDAKLYEKSCQEAALAEARAKRCYEDLSYQLERLYGQ